MDRLKMGWVHFFFHGGALPDVPHSHARASWRVVLLNTWFLPCGQRTCSVAEVGKASLAELRTSARPPPGREGVLIDGG